MPLTLSPIHTARLVLEPVSRELAQGVLAGSAPGIEAGEGWPHEGTRRGLQMALERGHAPGWFVVLGGVVIGDCGIHGEPTPAGDVEIGFGLAAPYHGRGYGTELVRAVSHWLLDQPDVSRVAARAALDNTPSRRTLERVGFVLEGDDGEFARYGLSR